MNQIETQIMRSIRQLAQKECANYDNGCCLPEDRPCHVISPAYKSIHDGAVGCDYFLEAVLAFRASHSDVTIEAAIPYAGQAEHWRGSLRDRYYALLEQCDCKTVVQQAYSGGCMMRRNRYMVDQSRVLIAAYNGEPGGTMNTMLYAMRRGLNVIEIPVETE